MNEFDERLATTLIYKNHREEIAMRRIWPIKVRFGSSHYHSEPQWLLDCYDFDKLDFRTYALKNCDFLAGNYVEEQSA
jgi:predicted DNA-binding transcriptional regulator YafY